MNENFKNWLIKTKNFSVRSAGDVLCRLNRASSLTELNPKLKTDQILFNLSQESEFQALSMSVRSQLRRSIKLYRHFLELK